MDWYTHDETGNLHWYNGNYENKKLDNPEGYSHLGDDDYFGDDALGMIDNFLGGMLSEEFDGEDVQGVYLPTDLSEQFANESGFAKVPTEVLSYSEDVFFAANGGINYYSEEIVYDKFSYVPDNYGVTNTGTISRVDVRGNTLDNWSSRGSWLFRLAPARLTVSRQEYQYGQSRTNYLLTASEVAKLVSDVYLGESAGNKPLNRTMRYTWSTYPSTGILNQFK